VGELLLANILREILPSSEFYALQHRFKNGEIVDAVIKLKDGCIPIDSKFPLDNFRRMIETPPGQDAAPARREFIRNVKKHIDDVAKKYILPDEGTLPFALMYIPAENVYYEIIVRPDKATEGVSNGTDPADIYSYATVRHVFPVSPNSLYPYLMTLSLGFRGLRIEERSREILDHLARVYGDLERFRKDFSVVGSHISDAAKKFSDAEKKLDRVSDKLVALREGESQEAAKIFMIDFPAYSVISVAKKSLDASHD
jgi:DNA recombination protein RmuC